MADAFTIEHFERYVSNLQLDTGDYWDLEEFQGIIVEPLLWHIKRRQVYQIWTIVPEGNAKTTLMAGVALYCADYAPLPWIPIAASSRDQAEILAQQAYQMIRSSPFMQERFRIYEGYRRIQPIRPNHPNPGTRGIKVYAADVGTNDGVIPFPIALCDEGHRHPNMSLYKLWKGKLRKRHAVIAMISTAGEPGHEFEEMRDAIRDQATEHQHAGGHTRSIGPSIVMNEWKVDRTEDIADMEKVKAANPLSTITVDTLTEDFNDPTMDMGNWKRLKCNIPSRASNAAISDTEWDKALCQLEFPDEIHIDLGIDVAWKHDTFAIVPQWHVIDSDVLDQVAKMLGKREQDHFFLLGQAEILIPPRDGTTLHPDNVKIALEGFMERFEIDTAVIDMERAEDIAAWMETECGIEIIDRPQGNASAAEDYETFMKGLRTGKLKHNGHSGLRAHVMNAIARSLPNDKRRFDRPSQSRSKRKQDQRVIDALTASGMVYHYGSEFDDFDAPLVGWR